jgi:hypothetical protein
VESEVRNQLEEQGALEIHPLELLVERFGYRKIEYHHLQHLVGPPERERLTLLLVAQAAHQPVVRPGYSVACRESLPLKLDRLPLPRELPLQQRPGLRQVAVGLVLTLEFEPVLDCFRYFQVQVQVQVPVPVQVRTME